jgi:hypothetical protein
MYLNGRERIGARERKYKFIFLQFYVRKKKTQCIKNMKYIYIYLKQI